MASCVVGAVILSLLAATGGAVAQEPSPQPGASWTPALRQQALARADHALGNYFYPDRIEALRKAIESNRQALLQIADQRAFAKALTSDLQGVSGDKHLIVWYSDAPHAQSAPRSSETAGDRNFFRHIDYGFNNAGRLTGNVGYLSLGGFANMPDAKPTLDAAMALVSPTNALILDLRGNAGGDSDTVAYLLGYFFARPTEVTGAVVREHGQFRTDRDFTPATVGGQKYLAKPAYILIDRQTISAGEMFAYDMKTLHRALVIGEPSAGAAMGLGSPPFYLTDHLSISVPDAETRNPYTGSNWDGTGVIPDVSTKSNEALLVAYKYALQSVNDRYDPMNELPQALKDPAAALRASFPDSPP